MPKILIADDNTNIQKMVALAFEERGIDVVSVGNGETAVRKLPDVNPDLVLADVFMPVRNGYEVCEFVKKDDRYAHVPVILLVGAFDPLDEKEARRVGADGVLKKPFVPPDPLIAMVMSALERNPRVAAELAKAKEVVPEPEPMPVALENPAQKAPAPLPDFPEPSPEEAAQIYGFGKGVRTLDDAEEESKNSAPKKPAAEEEDEEFDGSTTRRDWRRRGMDLDIPDEIAAKPAFSTDQDFSPISFPSEKDVPPRHVRVSEPQQDEPARAPKPHLELPLEPEEPPVKESKQEVKPLPPVAPPPGPPFIAPVSTIPAPPPSALGPEHSRPSRGFFASLFGSRRIEEIAAAEPPQAAAVVAPTVASAPAAIEEPAPSPVVPTPSPIASVPAPFSLREPLPQREPRLESKPEPHHEPEPESTPAAASHWMDLMSPSPAAGSGSWLDALSPKEESAPTPVAAVESPASASVAEPEISEPAPAANAEPAASVTVEEPPATEIHYEGAPVSSEPELSSAVEPKTEASQPRAFGRDADRSGFSYHFAGDEHDAPAPHAETTVSYEAAAQDPAVELPAVSEPEPPFVAASAPQVESSFFADETSEAEPVVASEPLPEPIAPPHEFAAETTVAETVSQIFSSASQDSIERIPTAPPPNREALAGIPFLVPPKEITEPVDVTSRAAEAAPAVDVEAVVQRVVERLGPQLQEMLAQGLLKPLVESLLQQELAKKDK